MDEETDIPFPVRFNPFKHHRNYILDMLNGTSAETIIGLLDPICNNYIDIYTGEMNPDAIGNAVISILNSNRALQADAFTHWVTSKNGYRQIKLEDQSEWIVRKGNETERYIHIHPARTGAFTLRFKGSTLKTVYQLKINYARPGETLTLEKVNRVREHVGLPPLKKLEQSKGILNCYRKFFDQR
ncbi:MAG: hypothetical protein Q8908_11045 [Bacteroidota bacterium]|nr:hypothetical protein [Bacteroidota bacterium]